MWTYSQKNRTMSHNGIIFTVEMIQNHNHKVRIPVLGYAGKGLGLNDPTMEDVANTGPLPRGKYTISSPRYVHSTGNYTMPLEPCDGHEMYGRTLFRIHGDNKEQNFTASEGCIVIDLRVRKAIWKSQDLILEVIE